MKTIIVFTALLFLTNTSFAANQGEPNPVWSPSVGDDSTSVSYTYNVSDNPEGGIRLNLKTSLTNF